MCTVKFTRRSSLVGVLVLMALIFAACSTDLPQQEHPMLSVTVSPGVQISIPATRPMVTADKLTITPTFFSVTPSPAVAAMTLPPPDVDLKIYPIDVDFYRSVQWASWSENEDLVYYAFSQRESGKSLTWAAYDIANQVTSIISSPLKYDPGVWQRLNVPDLVDSVGYPELRGYVSPSGKHVIYTVVYGNPGPGPMSTPYPSARTEIWISDSNGRNKTKLFSRYIGHISQAVWFENETKVIFDFGYEGGISLDIADVRTGKLIPLPEASGFRGTEQKWAVSPDGTTLAVIDFSYQLLLISLKDEKTRVIEKNVVYPYWSKDSKTLYYWWGPSFMDTGTLRAYDVISESVSTLVPQSSFARAFNTSSSLAGDFAISSSGDKILLWGGDLWLVELRK